MLIIIITREECLTCLYCLPCAQHGTRHSNVLSHLTLPVLQEGAQFLSLLCRQGNREFKSSPRSHSEEVAEPGRQAVPPKSHVLGRVLCRSWLSPLSGEEDVSGGWALWRRMRAAVFWSSVDTQPNKHSIMSVYLLLLFTALFPKWIVCLSKEHLPLLQSLVNKIIFAFPQICMSLISLATRTQEPVQETHSWAHTNTPGKNASQTNIIRIK